jgi:hypothetical protein
MTRLICDYSITRPLSVKRKPDPRAAVTVANPMLWCGWRPACGASTDHNCPACRTHALAVNIHSKGSVFVGSRLVGEFTFGHVPGDFTAANRCDICWPAGAGWNSRNCGAL